MSTNTDLMTKYNLRTEQDELMVNAKEGHPFWSAVLNNGLTVYQDDFREYDMPDSLRYSSWSRLRHYCYTEGVDITNFYIQFRTNRQEITGNGIGFYFCKSVFGGFGMEKSLDFFVTGTPDKAIIQLDLQRWQLPELIKTEDEKRDLDRNDVRLILNKDFR